MCTITLEYNQSNALIDFPIPGEGYKVHPALIAT